MSKRRIFFIILAALVIVAVARIGQIWLGDDSQNATAFNVSQVDDVGLAQINPVDQSIAQFQGRVGANPDDFISRTVLAELYLRKAKETGDITNYARAEAALDEVLETTPDYSTAKVQLASAYFSQHRFDEALELAQEVYDADPNSQQALSIVGDAHLELGNYQKAQEIYQQLVEGGASPAVLARMSHMEYLNGNTKEAIRLMERATQEVWSNRQTPYTVAWYLAQMGDLYFKAGQLEDSSKHYGASLKVVDDYYIALTGLGKVRAAQGKYDEAISLYQQVVNTVPEPATVAALGDLYMKVGDAANAQVQYDTIELMAKLSELDGQVYSREIALFYADHDMKLDAALTSAQKELEVRKDIYGYDTLAWALYKNGRFAEANEAMSQALSLGTQDANLYYHAGMIYYGTGDTQQAKSYLEQALDINPRFSPIHADTARQVLDALD